MGNAARHSQSEWVAVELDADGDSVALQIIDGGTGFDVSLKGGRTSLGLISMSERARGVGGGLEIESSPGEGTTLRASVPRKH